MAAFPDGPAHPASTQVCYRGPSLHPRVPPVLESQAGKLWRLHIIIKEKEALATQKEFEIVEDYSNQQGRTVKDQVCQECGFGHASW